MEAERIFYHLDTNVRKIHQELAKFHYHTSMLWDVFKQEQIDFILMECNMEAFLGMLEYYQDLGGLHDHLQELLDRYVEFYKGEADESTLIKQWLDQTQFICKTEYRKTKIEAHNETVKWIKDYRKKHTTIPGLKKALRKQKKIGKELVEYAKESTKSLQDQKNISIIPNHNPDNIFKFKETAAEYIEKYDQRLSEFIAEFEATELDFTEKELEIWYSIMSDIQNITQSTSPDISIEYSLSGIGIITEVMNAIEHIGYEKFYYSTKKKIKFLQNKKPVLEPAKEQAETKTTSKTTISDTHKLEKHFSHLKGNNLSKEKIMSDREYKRLIMLVAELIDTEELPQDESHFILNGITGYSIKYSFYLLHQEQYGTIKIKGIFIEFLSKYFTSLHNWSKKTLKTKFSVKPNKFPF